jgi:hypothetical protein
MFQPLSTTGVPLALRDDWENVLATCRELGTTVVWPAAHGWRETHDRMVHRAGAYQETLLGIDRMRAAGMEVGCNVLLTHENVARFDAGFRQMVDGEEVPILRLRFGPTDYFTQIVTDLNIANPARNHYTDAANLTEKPVPEFASILGVNLSLVTADGYLIVSERSKHAYLAGGRLHTSVAENILRPIDAGIEGAPDPFRAAARDAHEELGIQLDTQSLEFGAFGVESTLCQYSLFAAHRISQTRDDILKLRSVGAPKDKWESSRLLFVPFAPTDVAIFVAQTKEQWLPIGLAAIILGLWQIGCSLADIEAAFSAVNSANRDA